MFDLYLKLVNHGLTQQASKLVTTSTFAPKQFEVDIVAR